MEPSRYPSSFLLTRFREFYREVARLRRTVELATPLAGAEDVEMAMAAAVSTSGGGTVQRIDPMTSVNGVWQQLLTMLERQAVEAGQSGGAFAFEVYREAQYVMAALADEIFLHLEWEGRESWPLLESRLFQSHMAGEIIFQRLERLLQRRDPFYLDLASVYFMALSLGFQGKYRGSDDPTRLAHYRRQLFAMIYGRHPKLFTENTSLFPEAYQNTIVKGAARKLPDQRIWLALVGIVLVVWLAASQLAWSSVSTPLADMICRVTSGCSVGAGK